MPKQTIVIDTVITTQGPLSIAMPVAQGTPGKRLQQLSIDGPWAG